MINSKNNKTQTLNCNITNTTPEHTNDESAINIKGKAQTPQNPYTKTEIANNKTTQQEKLKRSTKEKAKKKKNL